MKKYIMCLLIGCLLAGCGSQAENPYRVDTVVQIPVDPTEAPTEAPAEITEPAETEVFTEPETTPEETAEKSPGKSSGGKTSSGGKNTSSGGKTSSSGSKNSSGSGTKATEPAATEAPTAPPTEPPATEAPTEPPYDPSAYSVGSLEYAILDAINGYRTEAGLSSLYMSTKLSGIAALRAREAASLWSHSRPDGRNFTSALSDYGYGYGTAAENLAHATGSDAQSIVDKWMSADGNSAAILNSAFTTAGIGLYSFGGVTYVANILVG